MGDLKGWYDRVCTRLRTWIDGRDWVKARARLKIVLFSLGGAVLALALFGHVDAQIGPFDTTVSARLSFSSDTVVTLAPLGEVRLDTHSWPLELGLRVDQLGFDDAQRFAAEPERIERLGDDVPSELASALRTLLLRSALVAIVGAVLGGLAARVSWRAAITGALTGGALLMLAVGGTVATFDTGAVSEPRYSGLLTMAPRAVGNVEDIIDRYGEYRAQLSDLVGNITTLYLAAEGLPVFDPGDDTIKVLHVSDLHLSIQGLDIVEELVGQFEIDAVADTGDITDWGTVVEDRYTAQIGRLGVPYLWVRGNHDSRSTQRAMAEMSNVRVLDDNAETVAGLRFWGIGDPRYTPDRQENDGVAEQADRAETFAPEVAERVDEAQPPGIDVAMVHDPRAAADLGGHVPLVLAGHTHTPDETRLSAQDSADAEEGSEEETTTTEEGEDDGEGEASANAADESATAGDGGETLMLTEGSTGGAGLRGLQDEEPTPHMASILYFDDTTKELLAYDQVSVAGVGGAGVTIDRNIVATEDTEAVSEASDDSSTTTDRVTDQSENRGNQSPQGQDAATDEGALPAVALLLRRLWRRSPSSPKRSLT